MGTFITCPTCSSGRTIYLPFNKCHLRNKRLYRPQYLSPGQKSRTFILEERKKSWADGSVGEMSAVQARWLEFSPSALVKDWRGSSYAWQQGPVSPAPGAWKQWKTSLMRWGGEETWCQPLGPHAPEHERTHTHMCTQTDDTPITNKSRKKNKTVPPLADFVRSSL